MAPCFQSFSAGGTVQTGSLTLQWTAPVARADGTPLYLADIDGYRIFYGASANNYPNRLEVQMVPRSRQQLPIYQ